MKKLITFVRLVVFWIPFNCYGQSIFQKSFYIDSANVSGTSFVKCFNGDYLLLGRVSQNTSKDIYLLRTDSSGNTIWSKKYSSNYDDYSQSFERINNSDFLINGFRLHIPITPPFLYINPTTLQKINENGSIIWSKTFLDTTHYYDFFLMKTITVNGNIYGAGTLSVNDYFVPGVNSDTLKRGFLMKADTAGNLLWVKKYGDIKTIINDFEMTTDSGLIMVGYSEALDTPNYDRKMIYCKVDNNGNLIWSREWDSDGILFSILNDGNGYLIGGGGFGAFAFKIDELGNVLWSKSYGGLNGVTKKIIKLSNSKIVLGKGAFSFWLTDSDGTNPNTLNIVGFGADQLSSFIAEPSGGLTAIGSKGFAFSFFKTDSDYFHCATYFGPVSYTPFNLISDSSTMLDYSIQGALINDTFAQQSVTTYDSIFCKTATFVNETDNNSFKIYPIPFSRILNIEFDNFNTKLLSLQLLDLTGRIVSSVFSFNNNKYIMDDGNISGGMYFLKLTFKNEVKITPVLKF